MAARSLRAELASDLSHAVIVQLRELGKTIVLAEQNSRFCLDIATRVAVIDKGRIVWRGSVEQFRADPSVQARYLQV